jgi:transcriptional regulator with XRE-family HTH domain
MYSAGGALQGAATGGMMASMMAPMFGPAAPLVIGLGALVGGVHGMISASEENTKALEENAKNIGGQIAQSIMSSTAVSQAISSLSPAEMKRLSGLTQAGGAINKTYKEKEQEIINKYRGPQDILNPASQMSSMLSASPLGASLSGFLNFSSSTLDGKKKSEIEGAREEMEKQAAGERKSALMKAFKSMPIGEQFMAKSLNKVDGKYDLKERAFDRKTYLKELKKLDPQDKAAQEALKKVFEDQVVQAEKTSVNLSKENKAIILRLNLQKAIMLAQMNAKEAQIDIKEKYFKQSNMIDAQTKILGGLMSEEQKVRLKYNQSLIKNSETREAGERAAKDAMRLGILQDIKGSRGGNLEQALKQALFKDKSKNELADVKFEDLTGKLNALGAKELLAIMIEIGKKTDEANKINEQRTAQFNHQVSILDKQKTLSDNIASTEYRTNDAVAKRIDLMKDVNREMQEYVRELDYAAQKRAIESEIQSARFSAGPVRSQEETFADMQRTVGERQKNIRDEYTKSAITDMQKFADEVGLTEKQRLEVADDPKLLKGMTKSFISEEEKAFAPKASRIQELEQELGAPYSDEYRKKNEEQFKKQEEELRELKVLEQSIADAKSQTLKQESKVIQKLQDQLNITNQKIKKEAELQKIKEGEYLRKTGPGAFGEGMKDASQDMRNEIALMDYELGKNIPRNFANGMATALTEAINGAKDLDDALRDAAINFLGAIQQAMMQKMAMQAVTAMGFSQGGSVKKYSNGGDVKKYSQGGNVPAMVTNGEYVMGRDAVKKYGGGFMHRMNAGGEIAGYSNGGDISDRKYRRSQMSGYFYSGQSGSIGLKEDEQTVRGLIAERERKRQEEEARRRAKKAKKRQLWGMLGSTIAMGAIGHMIGGINFGGGTPTGKGTVLQPSADGGYPGVEGYGTVLSSPSSGFTEYDYSSLLHGFDRRSYGGKINKYATGGHISGKSGIDQIPAMLSEGEYVIKASSARQIGKPMLDRINAGKFYNGGEVSNVESTSESGISGGNTNNINISINVKKGQTENEQMNSDRTSSDPAKKDKNEQDNVMLADKIKQQVVAVIVEEQRPGGLLND